MQLDDLIHVVHVLSQSDLKLVFGLLEISIRISLLQLQNSRLPVKDLQNCVLPIELPLVVLSEYFNILPQRLRLGTP